MAKGKLIEQLDDAVEALVAKPNAPQPASDPRLAAILRIAGELRDLPRAGMYSGTGWPDEIAGRSASMDLSLFHGASIPDPRTRAWSPEAW